MGEKTLEAIVASPPERDDLVIQLFVKDGGQWGEIIHDSEAYVLELYPKQGAEVRRIRIDRLTTDSLGQTVQALGWSIDIEEAIRVVQLGVHELSERQE